MIEESSQLIATLARIDRRPYPAYKDLRGRAFRFRGPVEWDLRFDRIQGDPFAAPSHVAVRMSRAAAGFPEDWVANTARRIGVENLIARRAARVCREVAGRSGSGKSGLIEIDAPGQEVLARTAVRLDAEGWEMRLAVGLPADGRRISGRAAEQLLAVQLEALAGRVLRVASWDASEVTAAAETNEDAEALRAGLRGRGLIAFVADGAILPRAGGNVQTPLAAGRAVAFESPAGLRVALPTPNAGLITGMGIPEGVTLIVGGGFHGKSTLLEALARGVFNHCPGDGRERVVCREDAVSIEAESGRSVAGVDISPFIADLPDGSDTRRFSTDNASGSTSQAAGIVEALEAGARLLLIDEDTAATNFMVRDRRMQELITRDREPITPFVDRVHGLWERQGVSTVLVLGGCGDYFDVADTVVAMDAYRPFERTEAAAEIARRLPTGRKPEAREWPENRLERRPDPASLDASRGRREIHSRARRTDSIEIGRTEIDLSGLHQIVHPAQTRALAAALAWAVGSGCFDGRRSVVDVLGEIRRKLDVPGLDGFTDEARGDFAEFRTLDFAAALNRLRGMRMRQAERPDLQTK